MADRPAKCLRSEFVSACSKDRLEGSRSIRRTPLLFHAGSSRVVSLSSASMVTSTLAPCFEFYFLALLALLNCSSATPGDCDALTRELLWESTVRSSAMSSVTFVQNRSARLVH